MSLICSYQNCLSIKYPCGTTAFFRLPTDSRRSVWIKNSGNKSLQNIGATAHRFFCEHHFRECDIRTQFNRKLLRKHAVPIEHSSVTGLDNTAPAPSPSDELDDNNDNSENRGQEENLIVEKLDDFPYATDVTNGIDKTQHTSEFSNKDEELLTEDHLQNTYTLIDLYLPLQKDDASEKGIEQTSITRDEYQDIDDDTEINLYKEIGDIEPLSQLSASDLNQPTEDDLNQSIDEEQIEEVIETPAKRRKTYESSHNDHLPAIQNHHNNDYQEDKHFALSLVGYFQRLPKGKKALAKLRILQYLTELDIGLDSTI